jgi:hypothetical protein
MIKAIKKFLTNTFTLTVLTIIGIVGFFWLLNVLPLLFLQILIIVFFGTLFFMALYCFIDAIKQSNTYYKEKRKRNE